VQQESASSSRNDLLENLLAHPHAKCGHEKCEHEIVETFVVTASSADRRAKVGSPEVEILKGSPFPVKLSLADEGR